MTILSARAEIHQHFRYTTGDLKEISFSQTHVDIVENELIEKNKSRLRKPSTTRQKTEMRNEYLLVKIGENWHEKISV